MQAKRRAPGRAVACALLLGSFFFIAQSQAAIVRPGVGSVNAPADAASLSSVSASLLSSSGGKYTYLFTVSNLTSQSKPPYYGVKEIAVYSPIAPVAISRPKSTEYLLWDVKGKFSAWQMMNLTDKNKNGIGDGILEPGQTAPTTRKDKVFTLTFKQQIDPSEFSFAVMMWVPKTCAHFWVTPGASVCGQVTCAEADGTVMGLPGATIELVNPQTDAVVATVTTDASGNYTLSGAFSGDFEVRASAPDFVTTLSAPFTLPGTANTCVPTLQLPAAPVAFRVVNAIYGQVYFSDAALFRNMDSGNTLGTADLFNVANANPNVSYRYVGTIPSFPELGHFGGTGERPLWVIIQHELQPETKWSNYTFTNVVGVQSGIGTDPNRTPGPYTDRFLCSLPCDGPGTAHKVKTLKLEVQQHTDAVLPQESPTWTDLTSVTADGGNTTQSTPAAGDIPPGWMARTRFEIQAYPGIGWIAYATVQFQNVCGQSSSTVTVDPYTDPAP